MVNDYLKAKIYTIRNRNDNTLIYVGSTVQPLCKRFCSHKNESKENKTRCLLHEKMSQSEDIKDWYIELHENYPCNNKEQLLKREGEITREIGTLNQNIAGRTPQIYYQDNKDSIIASVRDYQDKNKEKVKKWCKEYYNKHRESRLAYQREYYYKKKNQIFAIDSQEDQEL